MYKKQLLMSIMFVLAFVVAGFSADVRDVDAVRKKDVLADGDLGVIKAFVDAAVMDIVYAGDLTKTGQMRSAIVSRKSSASEGAKAQYEKAFNEEIIIAVKKGFGEADKLDDKDKTAGVKLNLILLVNELSNTAFLDLVMDFFGSSDPALRYAAISSVGNKAVIEQLNAVGTSAAQLSKTISAKLKGVLEKEDSSEIVVLITEFAGQVNGLDAMELLTAVADKRIAGYENWKVSDEVIDVKVLNYLGKKAKASPDSVDKAKLTGRFAQLYSYVFQRYDKGAASLSDIQKDNLITVMVATEQGILAEILGSNTGSIKKAVERKDNAALMAAHNSILGSEGAKGLLSDAIAFDYGKNGETVLVAPKVLADPPARN